MTDPDNPAYIRVWRNSPLTNEAASLEEMVEMLEAATHELRRMLKSGKVWLVPDTADDDSAELGTDSARVAEQFGFEDAETIRSGDMDDPENFTGDLDSLAADDD